MPPGRLLLVLLLLLSGGAAEANAIEQAPAAETLSFSEAAATDDKPAPAPKPTTSRIDAPPVLPLFAAALALLGWRLGRRRSP
jgi:hypothetical protein